MAVDSLLSERPRTQSSFETNPCAQFIPTDELAKRAKADFSEQMDSGLFSERELKEFVKEKVVGVNLNGVNVISVDFEHRDRINPILKAYVKSLNTRVVVAEYFYPEIKNNVEGTGLLSTVYKIGGSYTARIEYAKELSEICREADKPVAVADIANKARYILFRAFFRTSPLFLELFWGILGVQPELFLSLSLPIIGASIAWNIGMLLGPITGKGIFDKNRVESLEKFVLDFEQARRFNVARGIE